MKKKCCFQQRNRLTCWGGDDYPNECTMVSRGKDDLTLMGCPLLPTNPPLWAVQLKMFVLTWKLHSHKQRKQLCASQDSLVCTAEVKSCGHTIILLQMEMIMGETPMNSNFFKYHLGSKLRIRVRLSRT